MGCFNYTCGISSLPIRYDEDVYLIMLTQYESTMISLSYCADDNLQMFAFPIQGKYNEYGSIEEIQCEDYIWEFIKSQTYFEYSNSKKNNFIPNDIEHFVEHLSYGTLSVLCGNALVLDENKQFVKKDVECSLTYMLVHKELYELVVNHIYETTPYILGKSNIKIDYYGNMLKTKFTNIINENRTLLNELLKIGKSLEDDFLEVYTDMEYKLRISDGTSIRKSPSIINWLYKNNQLNENEIETIVKSVCLLRGLNDLRKGFYCLSGLGHQGENYYIHKLVNEWTLKKIDSVYKDKLNEENENNWEREVLDETLYWLGD